MGKVKGFDKMTERQKEDWIAYYSQRAATAISDKAALLLAIDEVVGLEKAAKITAIAFRRFFANEDKL